MDNGKIMVSKEVLDVVDTYDSLPGEKQLELLAIIFERLEDEGIEMYGKHILPEDIGIDDAYACCAIIQDMIYAT